jgi:hypothetical protein
MPGKPPELSASVAGDGNRKKNIELPPLLS